MKQNLGFTFDGDVTLALDVDTSVQDPKTVEKCRKRLERAFTKAIREEFGKGNIYDANFFASEGEWSDPC